LREKASGIVIAPALDEEPDECELLTDVQVDQLCASAFSVPQVGLLKPGREAKAGLRKYLDDLKAAWQNFSDFIKLLSVTGAREQETIRQLWPNVRWSRRQFLFPGGRKDGTTRGAGSGQATNSRDIDFFDKLEFSPEGHAWVEESQVRVDVPQ
jgi:hypothetical protein